MRPISICLQAVVFVLSLVTSPQAVFGLGADHPKDGVSSDAWPKGMAAIVNSPQRIHGYFVNAEDVFFFVGDQKQFEELLMAYAKVDGLVAHKIVIHEGRGLARSPWQETGGVACDWMVYGCPASWKRADPAAKGYILEVHLWKEGKIKVDTLELPGGILVEPAKDSETTDPN